MKLFASMCASPHHYHHDLAFPELVILLPTELIYRLAYKAPARAAWWNPCQSTPLLCSKPPITSEEKAQSWGLQDHSFLLPTPTVRLTVHCAPATLACCSSTPSIYGGTLGHHIHLSSLSCLFLCLYHYLMYFNCWLVYCPPPCTRMWAPWRQGFASFFVHCCIPWCLNQCLAHNKCTINILKFYLYSFTNCFQHTLIFSLNATRWPAMAVQWRISENVLLGCGQEVKSQQDLPKLLEEPYGLDTDLLQIYSPAQCFQWLLLLDTFVEVVLPSASYNELCCLDRKGDKPLVKCIPCKV